MVTPAFFNNKLRPSGAAEKISDEAVAAEQKAKDEKDNITKLLAIAATTTRRPPNHSVSIHNSLSDCCVWWAEPLVPN